MSSTETQSIMSAQGIADRKEKDGKAVRRLRKKVPDEETIIALLDRVCLHEEEEYQKIKASWLDACDESPAKGAHNCHNIRVALHEDKTPADIPSSSSSPSPSSSSLSSSSLFGRKDKIEEMVSFGEICEILCDISKLPESLVRAQTIYCCRTALAHYNTVHRTHYELVEPLRSGRSVGGWAGIHNCVAFHCNFTAVKRRNNNTPCRPKLFYADFVWLENMAFHILCCIVDPADALHNNCVICPPDLSHCPCKRHQETIISAEGNPNRKEIDGDLLLDECRRLKRIALWDRVCFYEEEEYQNIKASWLDDCHESPAKDTIRVACHEDKGYINFPSSSSSPPSSSSHKDKIEKEVSYGQICESLWDVLKLPKSLQQAQTIYCSRTALAHYNMIHGTQYELVEPLLSGREHASFILLHCNFTAAKLKKNSTPSRPKLFYAEFWVKKKEACRIQCCILKPASALCNTCRICPPDLAHCPCKRHRLSPSMMKVRILDHASAEISSAKTALNWYNEAHGADYVLVKALNSKNRAEDRVNRLYHGNFMAKLNSPCDDDSPKLFFTEIMKCPSFIVVLDCCILDTAETLDLLLHLPRNLRNQCRFCPYAILHPPFHRGIKEKRCHQKSESSMTKGAKST